MSVHPRCGLGAFPPSHRPIRRGPFPSCEISARASIPPRPEEGEQEIPDRRQPALLLLIPGVGNGSTGRCRDDHSRGPRWRRRA